LLAASRFPARTPLLSNDLAAIYMDKAELSSDIRTQKKPRKSGLRTFHSDILRDAV